MCLKFFKGPSFLISCGLMFHTKGPKHLVSGFPLSSVLTYGNSKSGKPVHRLSSPGDKKVLECEVGSVLLAT